MNILLAAYEYPPQGSGIANLVLNQKKSFTKLNHTVTVISTGAEADITVPVYFLIKRMGGIGICLFWILASIYLALFSRRYDRIYIHNPICVYAPSNSILVMHTLYKYMRFEIKHGVIMRWYNYCMYTLERLSYMFYTHKQFIVTSQKSAVELKSYRCNNIVAKIPNGIEKSLISLNNTQKDYSFITVSRLSSQKNLFNLIKIFNQLPQFTLTIVGDGELRGQLERVANSNIHFTGKIVHAEVFKLYTAHNFFISASSYEGYPLTLSEAIGCGCVPVLSGIPVYKEVINDLGCGLVYGFENVDMLQQYIENLDLAASQKKCFEYAQNNLDWDIIAEKYLV